MKNLYRYIKCVILIGPLFFITSCDKLSLMKDADLESVDAGLNLRSQTMGQYLSADHSSDMTALNLFADAIRLAGLQDVLESRDDYTAIFLTNDAIKQMLSAIGYPSVTEAPPIVLKNLLSDLIFKGKIKSFELALNETRKFETINGGYVYLTRTSTSSDEYVLYVNRSNELSATAALVRSQNLEFANGVAHVTSQFTNYRLADEAPDAGDPAGQVITEKINVTKDVFIQGGGPNQNRNFNDAATIDLKAISSKDATVGRRGILQYPLNTPSFGKRIGNAKLNVYMYTVGLTSSTTFSFSAYLGEDKDWNETGVTWLNAPSFNSIPLNTVAVKGGSSGWVSFDITSAVNELYANDKSFINIFLEHNVDNFIKLRPREFSGGQYQSYITVTSPPQTILNLGNLNTWTLKAGEGIYKLTSNELQMTGTEDKNITYTLKQKPENGYLVKYGIPLENNAAFSQADIVKGAIKYLYKGSGSADQALLEVRDHNGGYYGSDLNLQIVIN